jgi:predicted dehydrogenase
MKSSTFGGATLLAAGSVLPTASAASPESIPSNSADNGTASPLPGTEGKRIALAPPEKQPDKLELPEVVKKKVGWALVGLGELTLGEIMPAFGGCKYSKPVALVSGHPDKAKRVASAYGMKEEAIYDYAGFDKIADNPEIEAVYIVLPNSMHAEFTIRAVKAGKHVLCEKPMATTLPDCEKMIAAADEAKRLLAIAYRLHYEPLNLKVMEMCKNQELGKVKSFSSINGQNVKAPNIRLSGELGGGPVGDVGVYSINAARYVTGEEPVEVFAYAQKPEGDPRFAEVPQSVAYVMKFPSGVIADCVCSFGTTDSKWFRVMCDKGFIDMDPAFSYRGLKLKVQRDLGEDAKEVAELPIKQVNHFTEEMDHFSQCILKGEPPRTPGAEGLADMKIVLAIAESIKTGKPVKIS